MQDGRDGVMVRVWLFGLEISGCGRCTDVLAHGVGVDGDWTRVSDASRRRPIEINVLRRDEGDDYGLRRVRVISTSVPYLVNVMFLSIFFATF
jgi:hypothetical protein